MTLLNLTNDCNETRTHNHLIRKQILNHLAKLASGMNSGRNDIRDIKKLLNITGIFNIPCTLMVFSCQCRSLHDEIVLLSLRGCHQIMISQNRLKA